MTDEDFWKLVYLLMLHKGEDTETARAVANSAAEDSNDRWVNEAWSG